MQARYYDPVIGRFYSNDPIGFVGDVHSFNRYAYVGNNPYKYTDPTGMSRQTEESTYKKCEDDPNCSNMIRLTGKAEDATNEAEDTSNSSSDTFLLASKVKGQKKLTAGEYGVKSDPKDVKEAMNKEKSKNGASKHYKSLKGLLKVILRGGKVGVPFLLTPPSLMKMPPGFDSQGRPIIPST
jgi:uncharacterized protein RhaS with RHS repeats